MQRSSFAIAALGGLLCAGLVVLGPAAAPTSGHKVETSRASNPPAKDDHKQAKTFDGTIASLNGELFILRDDANDTWYHLDDQAQAAKFQGKNVSITGTLDGPTDTIHVQTIREAPRQKQSSQRESAPPGNQEGEPQKNQSSMKEPRGDQPSTASAPSGTASSAPPPDTPAVAESQKTPADPDPVESGSEEAAHTAPTPSAAVNVESPKLSDAPTKTYVGTVISLSDEVYVLRDNANWYCMDDWTRAEKFAGKRVSVTAALDPEGHMLHVRSIEESSK
ncbi:MAG TPA: DUF5818 domain-containing protein [Candidatus Limnocylindrales bacterium]|nr:DUF5818 domain-containing protein [Candidatus Limnocylindrales bacterium]